MPRNIIALVFRCKITGGHLTPNDEATAFHWADEADIRQLTSEAYAVRLLDALNEGAAPAIRQHDGTELLS
jgi:8-oxo-dGTP diphosphatase